MTAISGRDHLDRNAVGDARARRRVERLIVGQRIRVDPGLARARDAQLHVVSVVPEAVRQTNHARHHVVGHLDLHAHLANARAHRRATSVGEAETLRVARIHEQRAALGTAREHWEVVEPRVHAAERAPADQRELARAGEYPRIAAALEDYLIRLHNVEIAFRIILQFAFTSDSAFAELKTSIRRYNEAFEGLKQGRTGFEQRVARYWGSERLVGELRNVLDYALGEIHEIHVLPLNDVLPDITAVSKRQVSGQAAEQKREQVTRRVAETLRALQPRIQELDRRKSRLLSELQAL